MKILFLGTHIDDIELACLGYLLRLQAEGNEILYHVLCRCDDLERNEGFTDENLEIIKRLGLEDTAVVHSFKNRSLHYPAEKKRIRKMLEHLRNKEQPDLVLCPWDQDVHQDHSSTAEEVIRVFRYSSIIMYEIPHSARGFAPDYFVELPEHIVNLKLELCALYKSQAELFYWQEDKILAHLAFRGLQMRKPYAEAFKVWELKI